MRQETGAKAEIERAREKVRCLGVQRTHAPCTIRFMCALMSACLCDGVYRISMRARL